MAEKYRYHKKWKCFFNGNLKHYEKLVKKLKIAIF